MQINQSELKDLKAVVTLVIEPADYQEEVAKQLTTRRRCRVSARVWFLPVW